MDKRAFYRWNEIFKTAKAINRLRMTKSDISSLKRLASKKPSYVKIEEWLDLLFFIDTATKDKPIPVSVELKDSGIKLLTGKDLCYKCDTSLDLSRIAQIANIGIKEIYFIGFIEITSSFCLHNYPEMKTMIPHYMVESMDGSIVRYCYSNWQSGVKLMTNPPPYIEHK